MVGSCLVLGKIPSRNVKEIYKHRAQNIIIKRVNKVKNENKAMFCRFQSSVMFVIFENFRNFSKFVNIFGHDKDENRTKSKEISLTILNNFSTNNKNL